jgi:hypothetical protein
MKHMFFNPCMIHQAIPVIYGIGGFNYLAMALPGLSSGDIKEHLEEMRGMALKEVL